MSVIVLHQSAIHYESLGRGRPVLFLHTWAGSWRYWVSSLQAAAASHSAYSLDLFGFGESARDPAGYTIDSQAALVGSFLDEMGIERTALVAHGLGALVGLRFATENPRRIARILAVGLPLDQAAAYRILLTLEPGQLAALLDAKGVHGGELLPETNTNDPRAVQCIPEPDVIRRSILALQAAGIPVLIVNGEDDPLQPSAAPDRPHELETHVHEVIFPEAGHFPMLDAADAFQRLMIDFLALETGANPHQLGLKAEWRRRVR